MKILFPIGAFYPSQIGGPCNTVYWHTKELKKNGFEIDIVTTTLGIEKGSVEENKFIQKECGNVYYGKGGSGNIITIKTAFSKIKKSDVIHLNSVFDNLSLCVFFLSRFFYPDKKLIWSVRGELSPSALKYGCFMKKIVLNFIKIFASTVTFHSTSDQETLDINYHFKDAKVFQVPNLIKLPKRINPIEVKKQFLFIGRIHPIKAIHNIIEGLSVSKEFMRSNFSFILVGKNEVRHEWYLKKLKDLIAKSGLESKISFRGHVIGVEKEKVFARSYFTLLLSESENFGNVILESLNQGTPVITSLGTPWSIVTKYDCGLHISNHPKIIATAIDEIIKMDSASYQCKRNRCIDLVESEFNIENQIPRWIYKYETTSFLSKENKTNMC